MSTKTWTEVLAWGFMVFTTLIVIGMLRLWWEKGARWLDVRNAATSNFPIVERCRQVLASKHAPEVATCQSMADQSDANSALTRST